MSQITVVFVLQINKISIHCLGTSLLHKLYAFQQSTCNCHCIKYITALPAQISASNFHDLTQITQRRVRFNPKRTVFPCALGKSTLCGHKSNLYMPSKWLIIVFQRGPRDPPYTSSSSSLVRVWWQMSQWPQLAQGSHSSPQPSSVTCKAM